jgi:hypothetical protein
MAAAARRRSSDEIVIFLPSLSEKNWSLSQNVAPAHLLCVPSLPKRSSACSSVTLIVARVGIFRFKCNTCKQNLKPMSIPSILLITVHTTTTRYGNLSIAASVYQASQHRCISPAPPTTSSGQGPIHSIHLYNILSNKRNPAKVNSYNSS